MTAQLIPLNHKESSLNTLSFIADGAGDARDKLQFAACVVKKNIFNHFEKISKMKCIPLINSKTLFYKITKYLSNNNKKDLAKELKHHKPVFGKVLKIIIDTINKTPQEINQALKKNQNLFDQNIYNKIETYLTELNRQQKLYVNEINKMIKQIRGKLIFF